MIIVRPVMLLYGAVDRYFSLRMIRPELLLALSVDIGRRVCCRPFVWIGGRLVGRFSNLNVEIIHMRCESIRENL